MASHRRRARKDSPDGQDSDYLGLEEAEEDEVWLVWMDKAKEVQEKGVRQLAHEARQGNVHDENVLTYYR